MLKFKLLILFILISTTSVYAIEADDIIGKYRLPNKVEVKIYKYKSKYFGKIIALNGFENGLTKDINNPKKSKQNDLLIGKVIIKNLEYNKKQQQWINGSMYGAEKGMFFDLKITEVSKKEIVVVGSKFFFWKTLKWKKIL